TRCRPVSVSFNAAIPASWAAGSACRDPRQRRTAMSDATTAKSKTTKPAAFELPKVEMPKFEMPKIDVPQAFREFAENGVARVKEAYDKVKAAAEQANGAIEEAYAATAKGATDYNLKVLEFARAN